MRHDSSEGFDRLVATPSCEKVGAGRYGWLMAEFDIVDLTATDEEEAAPPSRSRPSRIGGQGAGASIGRIDTATVAAELESLRKDLSAHIATEQTGLHQPTLHVKLTLSAEGRVAFIAKGAAEACIEVTFASAGSTASTDDAATD